ncbi:uncharacterized protein LOC133293760 [Gastrolobium bilobum]|uniref:uncharacterized protein LOC133293760 n=1 Tax=Gastrolobium bilobum TaxID=150636 RepID=UPI002AB1DF4D|nr:uncharacterized protein LOC133293760 [Gastrolobium bilobum]
MTKMKKVERPRPIFDRGGLDKSKYCAFHDGPGHTTDQCWDVRDVVEKFVRDRRLRHKDERNQKDDSNQDEFPEAEFDCDVISGALGGGGDTVSARRKYLKEESIGCYFDTVKENKDRHSSPPRIYPGDKLGRETIPHYSRKPVNVVELDMREEIISRPEPDGELEDLALGKNQVNLPELDLEHTFQKLRKYRIRLNPVKYAFGVPVEKFLGFMLTHRGIEANPDKCKAVLDMKKGWNPECQAVFEKVKKCLATLPVLSKPELGDTLILYLAVGEEAISAVLIKETDKDQEPIYFTSRALQGAEVRYQKLEKVAFALLITTRRLRPYFQGHQIIVRTNQPIRQVLHKPDLTGRMTNWAIELSEYDIIYESRKAIKSQALADFIIELTPVNPEHSESGNAWKVYVDGSSNDKGSGAEIIFESPEGVTIEHSLNLEFPTSNNQAKYEALIAGLMQAKEHEAKKVKIFSDSQLVTSQIEGKYQAKGLLLMKYLSKVQEMMADFDEVQVIHIPRGGNCRVDILSKLESTKNSGNHRIVRRPIVAYLEKEILPEDRLESRKLVRDTTQYTIVNDQLFRKGLHVPMLKCLNSEEAEYVLAEIHERINGHHMGGKTLARKALRAGYYWPTMEADSKEHVKRCDSFQKHAKLILSSPEELKYISTPWPFFKWGMDFLGPFKAAEGQLK